MTPPWMKLFYCCYPLFFKNYVCAVKKTLVFVLVVSPCFLSLSVALALRGARSSAASFAAPLCFPSLSVSLSLFCFPSSALALGRRRRWWRQLLYKLPDPVSSSIALSENSSCYHHHRYPSSAKPALLNSFLRTTFLV